MDINLPMNPPVNNNIQSSLCDRLDAIVFEKIRVANTQLDTRLSIQEKVINKYRRDVEKIHAHQSQRLKREVKKIRQKKPDYIFDDSDVTTSRSRNTTETGRQRCLSEPSSLSYCRRYYSHHYNVKDTSKNDKKDKDGKRHGDNDFFNMKLRLYFVNMMSNAIQKTHLEHDIPSEYGNDSTHHPGDLDQIQSNQHYTQLYTDDNKNDSLAKIDSSSVIQQDPHMSITDRENETVFDGTNEEDYVLKEYRNSGKQSESGLMKYTDLQDDEIKDRAAKMTWDRTRGQRRNKGRRAKRKLIKGSVSEDELEYNDAERRKSKHAFEKIFSGLL